MNLTTMRENVETDLKDTGNTRWTDAELNRAIARALAEYSAAWPQVVYVDKTANASSRWYDLSAQTGYLWCEAVEYPIDDEDGPTFRLFRQNKDAKKVYVLGTLPTAGENIRFWYAAAHTLGASSTIPMEHEEVISLGAAAYAALSWANYAIDRINVSGWTPRQYREWAEGRLREFQRRLDGLKSSRAGSIGSAVVNWGETV